MPLVRISLMKNRPNGFGKGGFNRLATSLKKALFNTIADRLHREFDVRMEDVTINLVEVKKENRSFGNGNPYPNVSKGSFSACRLNSSLNSQKIMAQHPPPLPDSGHYVWPDISRHRLYITRWAYVDLDPAYRTPHRC